MPYIVLFKVEVFEWNGVEQENKTETSYGVIYANSYTEAASIIENYYGPDKITSLKIELLEDTIVTLPKDKFKEIETILKGGKR